MYIPILSSFSTRSGERAFAVATRERRERRCERREERGKVPVASASRCASPLFATDSTTHTDRSTASLITQTHHLYGAARQISKLRVEHRRADCHWELAIGSSCARMPAGRSAHHFSPYQSHTFEYVQTNRKEGRKSGYHESSSKRARLPPSAVHFLPEKHTESSTYRRISGREEG